MSNHHFWLSDEQFARVQPLLPNKPRGVPRVDDRRVISAIIHVIRNGLMWWDAPERYAPHKTLYNRFVRWSAIGVFNRIFEELAAGSDATETVMIDATHLKVHRTAARLVKRACTPAYRANEGRLEFETARSVRRKGQALDNAANRVSDQRLSRRPDNADGDARGGYIDRRPGL